MKVELEVEEARQLAVFVIDRLVEDAALPAKDVATLRKWRTTLTPGSEGIRELTAKLNADIARALENKKKSSVVKPDWR
jgi:hypothetical protein